MDREGPEGGEESNTGFQYVTRKGKANRKRRKGREEVKEDSESKLSKRVQIIETKKAFLSSGEVGVSFESLLETVFSSTSSRSNDLPLSILTLGLGSVKDSKAAQVQLAFLLLIRDRLKKLMPKEKDEQGVIDIEAYDPIFDQEDEELLTAYNIKMTSTNLQGRYTLEQPTFVFMPHCTRALYENILRSNWTPHGLARLWLCCNDLERYSSARVSETALCCIKRIAAKSLAHHLPALPSSHSGALNDLVIYLFEQTSDDPVIALANKFDQATVQDDGDFWILPDAAEADKEDPELL